MCFQFLAAAAPYIAGAGKVGSLINQQQALHAQDREAAAGLRRNQAITDEANARVRAQIDQTANAKPAAEEQTANQDFMRALKQAKVANGGDFFGGPGGSRFADDLGLARTAAAGEGKGLAERTAAIDAPQFQRQREQVGVNDTATALNVLGDKSRGEDYLTQLRVKSHQPNPWVEAGAELLGAFGGGLASRGTPVKFKPSILTPEQQDEITRGMTPWNTGPYGGMNYGRR
jgi:hypothetical protein